jgi:hypothetical protein
MMKFANNSICYLLYGKNKQTETIKGSHITDTILRFLRLKVKKSINNDIC